jgi:RND family efflux transporter MFP subunit
MHTVFSFLKSHVVLASSIVILAVAGTLIAGRVANREKTAETDTNVRQVTLVEAGTFRTGLSTIGADGVVESVAQVELKSQVSAPIARVYYSVGDTVSAGALIAELQNADIRAQLEQAKASLILAESQQGSSEVNLESARRSLVEKIRDSYSKSDNIINAQLEDILYRETSTQEGTVSSLETLVPNRLQEAVVLKQHELKVLTLPEWKKKIDTLTAVSSEADLVDVLKISRANLATISTLLDNTSTAINEISQDDAPLFLLNVTAGWKTIVDAARSSVSGSSAALTAAEAGVTGSGNSQVTSAAAQIAVAKAGIQALEAQLAKTIIRSPISGKIGELPLRSGELASPGQLIASVVGSGGLQVKAYASGEDFSRIQRNARATIEGSIPAVVTSIAPSVNSENKKLEVKLTILGGATSLVVGQSVHALIDASATSNAIAGSTYLLPMQNVKIIPGDAYVLTVNDQSKIEKRSVILGEIRGEFVEVKSGLADDLKIVTPVYELNEGETVRVQ